MKKRTFIARARKDCNYMFMVSDSFYCNPKKAQAICKALNDEKYEIFGDLEWKIFIDDGEWTGRVLYRGVVRGSCLYRYEIDID